MLRLNKFKLKFSSKEGFSLIEIMVVTGISSISFGVIVFNLIRFQGSSSQQSGVDSVTSDIKNQQIKAMLGNTEGGADSSSFGVYFYADRYILFRGSSFNNSDPGNFTIELPSDLSFQNTSFPGNQIVFEKLSGEISGFVPGSDSITVRAININRDIVITLNQYGVISGVN